eukprot:TRINITY_DN3653_c0_g1_i1.p1 TRINITY_DN3653_c0_g1~~TRINITY_DN3653_c0_g1_i1.p1  ORF type:complete len:354 (+),score=87.32 TRINITY_DN3653_c0_g1_i1:87-1148(+)
MCIRDSSSSAPVPCTWQQKGPEAGRARHVVDITHFYTFINIIGEGGCSIVYEATRVGRSNEKRAVKVVQCGDNRERARLWHEVGLLRALEHPNIVRLHEALTDPSETVYLAMELLVGCDVFDWIISRRGLYDESDAAFVLGQLGAALHYLHTHRIAHRDVKPENAIFTHTAQHRPAIKLIDLGFATIIPLNQLAYEPCGTPQYAAPDVLRGKGYGISVDVWSLGVLMFVMVCGQYPFVQDSGMYDRIMAAEYTLPPSLSPLGMGLLSSMLQKEPSDRIDITGVVRHKWLRQCPELALAMVPEKLRQIQAIRHGPSQSATFSAGADGSVPEPEQLARRCGQRVWQQLARSSATF